jgi:hypothetical protein
VRISGIAILALGAASLAPARPPFEVVWTRGFGDASYVCRPDTAVADSHGDLWAICDGFDYAQEQDVTTL